MCDPNESGNVNGCGDSAAMEVAADEAPNSEPMLPDYEEDTESDDVLRALRNGQTTFMLVKLPDESEPDKIPEDNSVMNDFEGQLVSVVLGPGQIRLLVGESTFQVRTGRQSSLPHERVSIVHDDETNTNDLVVQIGPVQQKITMFPPWDVVSRLLGVRN